MTAMPTLTTDRLIVRPLAMDDLEAIHAILDVQLAGAAPAETLEARRRWLQWTVLGYEQLALLHQPPYGERAVTLQSTGQLIGACGFAPCLDMFEQLPSLAPGGQPPERSRATAEVGLYWAISPDFQGHGYATEAAQALVDYAFRHLKLKRIIATTTYDNTPSLSVMRKLSMRLERNPRPEPRWLQVVGVLMK
jgi:RimJ/RimL family protein N-acetyltransferase